MALVILLAFGIWYFFLRFISEKHTVEHFMDAVVAQDYQRAGAAFEAALDDFPDIDAFDDAVIALMNADD